MGHTSTELKFQDIDRIHIYGDGGSKTEKQYQVAWAVWRIKTLEFWATD
ncbi:MAG: hypothetical protein P8Q37_05095 [Porticoccaceae bacterium]|nr:hypothetical protein [Porticoccaceae bacterium]